MDTKCVRCGYPLEEPEAYIRCEDRRECEIRQYLNASLFEAGMARTT